MAFKDRFKRLIFYIVPILMVVSLIACFRKFRMTDKDLIAYYKQKTYKPQFKSYKHGHHTIHYAEVGSDTLPLLLLIHGAPGAWYGYIHFLDDTLLRKHFKIISVDRPGYGKSGYGRAVTSIQLQSEYLSPILEKHSNGKPVIVVGRSFGAPVAAQLVANYQDKVKGLILVGAAIDPALEKFWWFSGLGNLRIIRWLLPKAMNVATDEKFSHIQELKKLLPMWSTLKLPVSIMHGADDWIVDTGNVSFAKRMLTNARLRIHIFPNTGHLVTNEKPDAVKKEVFHHLFESENITFRHSSITQESTLLHD